MNIDLPVRVSYTLNELQSFWCVRNEDLRHWLVNGDLTAHAWLPVMSVFKLGDHRKASASRQLKKLCHWEGYVSVTRHSCYRLFRRQRIYLREFSSVEDGESFCLPDTADDLSISLGDLIILREERDRFEEEHGIGKFQPDQANDAEHTIECYDSTFKTVRYGGRDYAFGDIQASILRQLHEAAQTNRPWCSGKRLLADAGSRSFTLSNIFKRNRIWRQIIISDGRGFYRISEKFMTTKKT